MKLNFNTSKNTHTCDLFPLAYIETFWDTIYSEPRQSGYRVQIRYCGRTHLSKNVFKTRELAEEYCKNFIDELVVKLKKLLED